MSTEITEKVYRAMIGECDARIRPLEEELKKLEAAGQRIAEIQVELQVLRSERAEYDALLPKTDTPKFDR